MARLKLNTVKHIIYKSLREGDSIKNACEKARITTKTYKNWIKVGKQDLPENIDDRTPHQEYYREFYLQIQWIKIESQYQASTLDDDSIESPEDRRKRRYIQAQKAFDDYLYGRHTTTWTNKETVVIKRPDEADEIHEKESVKTVTHPPARWAIEQILPNIDLVNLVQQSVELGILDPQVVDGIEELGEKQLHDIIAICKKNLAYLN